MKHPRAAAPSLFPLLAAALILLAGCTAAGSGSPADAGSADMDDTSTAADSDATADGDEEALETEAPEIEAEMETESEPICSNDIPARPFTIIDGRTFLVDPYLMNPSETGMTVLWLTEAAADGVVEFGLAPDALDQTVSDPEPRTTHVVELTGLNPDTQYYYRVTSGGVSTPVAEFYTAPPAGRPVSFTVWSDSHNEVEINSVIFRRMAERRPYFALTCGDIVNDGDDGPSWVDAFHNPLSPLVRSVPLFEAIGNHEGNAHFYYDYTASPPNHPDVPGGESFFAFTYGNVFMVVIDTNKAFYDIDVDPANPIETPFSKWLKEQLASDEAKRATWRIAAGHESGWSESWSPGDCTGFSGLGPIKNWLWPKLAENHFHAYLAGHTHDYERGMKDGVLQIILGGGGGGLDDWCRDFPETTVVRRLHHYLNVEAGCNELKFQAFSMRDASQPFDTVTLKADDWGQIASESTLPDPNEEEEESDVEEGGEGDWDVEGETGGEGENE